MKTKTKREQARYENCELCSEFCSPESFARRTVNCELLRLQCFSYSKYTIVLNL